MKNWFRERREKEAGNDPPRGKVNPVSQFSSITALFSEPPLLRRHPTFSNRFFLPTGLPSTIMFIQRLRTFPPLFLFFPESHEKSSCAGGSGELDKITWISLLRLSRILEEMNKKYPLLDEKKSEKLLSSRYVGINLISVLRKIGTDENWIFFIIIIIIIPFADRCETKNPKLSFHFINVVNPRPRI